MSQQNDVVVPSNNVTNSSVSPEIKRKVYFSLETPADSRAYLLLKVMNDEIPAQPVLLMMGAHLSDDLSKSNFNIFDWAFAVLIIDFSADVKGFSIGYVVGVGC
jgi:hypothetical protein